MDGPLWYLAVRSMRNRLRARLARLRQPRYAIGGLVAGLYFYQVFFRSGGGRMAEQLARSSDNLFPALAAVAAIALVAFAAVEWLWPFRKRPPVSFSASEAQFLFTAPLSERALMRYLVIRSQVPVLILSAIMTLLFRPASMARGAALFAGLAIVMTVSQLHAAGIVLRRLPGPTAERSPLFRRAAQLFVAAVAVALAASIIGRWDQLTQVRELGPITDAVHDLATTGAAGGLLWPFVMLTSLPLAESPAAFFLALPIGLALLVANYKWAVGAGVPLDALVADRQLAEDAPAGATPVARGKAAFVLGGTGRPEVAVLWKNLTMMGRGWSAILLVRFLGIFVVMGVVMAQVASRNGAASAFAVVCIFAAIFTVMMGPWMARNDLRQDLRQLEVLKTWPVRGAAIVRGELLAPLLVLSGLVAVFLAGATAFGAALPAGAGRIATEPITYGVSALLMAPPIILAQLTLQNAAALTFPAWIVTGAPRRAVGLDVMGQRMLMVAASFLVLAVCLAPAALVGALVGYGIFAATGVLTIIPGAAVAAGVIVAECLVATEALGALLDRTDISALDAPV